MEKEVFEGIMRGLGDVQRYMHGDSSGMVVHHVEVPQQVDVKAIRKKLSMTQEQFAVTFGFSLPALRHWERGDRTPERSARILLKVIEFSPETVLKATHATAQIHST